MSFAEVVEAYKAGTIPVQTYPADGPVAPQVRENSVDGGDYALGVVKDTDVDMGTGPTVAEASGSRRPIKDSDIDDVTNQMADMGNPPVWTSNILSAAVQEGAAGAENDWFIQFKTLPTNVTDTWFETDEPKARQEVHKELATTRGMLYSRFRKVMMKMTWPSDQEGARVAVMEAIASLDKGKNTAAE